MAATPSSWATSATTGPTARTGAAAVAELNRYPQFTARIEDFDLHFVHVVGEAGGRRPLLLSHGWPGSHYEFWGVIDKLAFPSRHGGQAADAFDLVIPSLPGFGFSSKPARPFGQRATARLFNGLMTEVLGYDRYLAQGGDWGALVTSCLGLDHADHVRAIHLNMMGFARPAAPPERSPRRGGRRRCSHGAHLGRLSSACRSPSRSRWPGSAAGNPVGQAAWIVERFYDWCDRRAKPFEQVFTSDQLLTNVMIYVMTGSFTTGAWYYPRWAARRRQLMPGQRFETPTAFANFPDPLHPTPPRSLVERAYDVSRWTEMPRGGHFAAMEVPELLVEDVRAWARETG